VIGRRRFSRDRHGRVRPGLDELERELLRSLPVQALHLLEEDDPVVARVFPVAYADDEAAQADYREMMGTQILRHHQESLGTLAATVDEPAIDEEQLHLWLDALEVLRLVLGTQLDVSEDMADEDVLGETDEERSLQLHVYRYLSMLQGEVIDTLATALPAGGTGGDDDPLVP